MSPTWRVGVVLLACMICVTVGFMVATGGFYFAAQWNNTLVVRDVQARTTVAAAGKQRTLDVHYRIADVPRCPSLTQHSLYQDKAVNGTVQRTVVPVGITVNGLGSPAGKAEFDIPFQLPPSVTAGAWTYTAIMSSSCEWFPGFVRQQVQQTTPVDVFVPGPPP